MAHVSNDSTKAGGGGGAPAEIDGGILVGNGERLGLPGSYSQMLYRIAFGSSVLVLLLTLAATHLDPRLGSALSGRPVKIPVVSIDLPLLYLLPAMVAFVVSRVLHFHDRISDQFGIRLNFDVDTILMRMVRGVGLEAANPTRSSLVENRRPLMTRCFYDFAGYNHPVIDRHLIQMALEAWSFYWVVLETIAFALFGALLSFIFGMAKPGLVLIAAAVIGYVLLGFLMRDCVRRAEDEVDEILADQSRQQRVREQLIAVLH